MSDNKMYGVINGVNYRQQDRTEELNNRLFSRNIPSQSLQPEFSFRPISTKYTLLPMIDQRIKSNVPLKSYPIYNTKQVFNPGNAQAPWSGFSVNVNTESKLRNQFFALQKCEQADFVPSSNSSLFVPFKPTPRENIQLYPDLFDVPDFEPFNPNTLNMGDKILNNSTRIRTLNPE
jgi:hypothetical protein|tara:strand:- start:4903 stop:5430 length:528 start_codon:yes stop_codon:yes gene_type:complete